MARKVTTVLSLRDNYTAVIKKARRYTSAFDKDVQKMTARLDKASAKKHDIKVKNSAAMKAMTALEKKIAPMRNIMVKVAANVQHFKNQIKPVTDTVKKIATKAWTVTVKLKDGVTGGLKKISAGLKKAGTAVAVGFVAALAAAGFAIGKGMDLESYGVSMAHFVGVNNPNSSAGQVQKQTDGYMKWLRTNANATPFGTEEVIQAGSRAVQIAEGNTNAAQGLVKMAEDMASLTPGKTVMDAMEALADANIGEFERMKEFGFKMSAEEFKASGYDLFSTKGRNGKTLVQVFGGGAEKFANTTAGMWSTITGEIESDVAEIGLEMARGLKPLMEWVRDSVLPDLRKFLFDPIKGSGKTGMETLTEGIKSVYYWLKDQIPLAINVIMGMWDGFVAAFNDPNGAIRQTLGLLGVNVPTINTEANTGGANTGGATSKPTYGEQPMGLPVNSVFANKLPEMPTVGGRQMNLGDAVTGYFALKGASIISKIFTGKGLLANGVKLGVKAGSTAATALGAASPSLNAALVNGSSLLSQIMAAGGSAAFAPAYYWGENQMTGASYGYSKATGKNADITKPKDWWKVFAWKQVDINKQMSENAQGWGDTVNRTMDGIFGIKRLPKGLPDLAAMGWLPTVSNDTAAAQWAGIPGANGQNPNAPKNTGSMYGGYLGMADYYKQVQTQPDTNGMEAAAAGLNKVGDAASYAAWNMETLLSYLDQVRAGGHGGLDYNFGTPKAAGIKRVPWDNYPALLHKGETVLPSGEAGEYRGHGNQAGKAGNNISLNITVNGNGMDENRLASILVNKLQAVALNMA